jgi:hypothetical protein
MSDDKKTPAETKPPTPAPTPAPDQRSAKRVDEPAPFVVGGTWTDGQQVRKTDDPDPAPPRTPKRPKVSAGTRKDGK